MKTHPTKEKTRYTLRRPAHATPKGDPARTRAGGLSLKQKARLNQIARQAFDKLDALGLVDAEGDSTTVRLKNWRHAEQLKAVGIASMCDCGNQHFRALKAHFLVLAGLHDEAFPVLLKTGRVKDHGALTDTHEAREEQRALMVEALRAHAHRCDPQAETYDAGIAQIVAAKGGVIGTGYVIAIAKGKCRGRGLDSLTAEELRQVLFTLINRISAREGRENRGRNKGQRKGGAQ